MARNEQLLIRINGDARNFQRSLRDAQNQTKDLEATLTDVAKVSGAAFAALTASLGVTVKVAADYETALVGVGKTTNITGGELQALGKDVQALGRVLPIPTNELLGIAQAAGQLGVTGSANLLKFTDTIAKLGTASDLSGEEAATALTRILTVTGEGVGEVDKFASAIVALGNNFAATESEIVRVTTEVSRATAVFDIGAGRAAAIATAMKSLGVQAELGGSATGRAFRAIDESIREGGAALENLSQLTGLTGEQLRKTFQEDATRVFQLFIEGLGRIGQEGGDTTAKLGEFGLKGEEILKVLPVLALNSDLLGKTLATASEEFANATALENEFAAASATTNNQLGLLKNSITEAAQGIGAELLPEFNSAIAAANTLVTQFNDLSPSTKAVIADAALFATGLAGITAASALTSLAVLKVRAAVIAMSAAMIASPIGLIVASLAAAAAAYAALHDEADEAIPTQQAFDDQIQKVTANLEAMNGATDEQRASLALANQEILKAVEISLERREALLKEAQATEELTFANEELTASINQARTDRITRLEADVDAIETQRDRLREILNESLTPAGTETPGVPGETRTATSTGTGGGGGGGDDALARKQEQIAKELELERDKIAQLELIRSGAAANELEFLTRQQEINKLFREADNTEDETLAQAKRERAQLLQAGLLEDLQAFEEQKRELDQEIRETKLELEEEQNEEDRIRLEEQLQQLLELRLLYQQRGLLSEEEFQKRLQGILQGGGKKQKTIQDKINQQSLASASGLFNALGDIAQGGMDRVTGIVRATALIQTAIDEAEALTGAVKAGASRPFPQNLIAIATGVAKVLSITGPAISQIKGAQQGGIVPGVGSGDIVPMMLEPGELVVPKQIVPNFKQAVGGDLSGLSGEGGGGTQRVVVEIELNDDAATIISAKQRENTRLGIG